MVTVGDGVVLAIVGGRYRVYQDGTVIEASIRGRMKQEKGVKVLVGDRVVLHRHPDDSATIEEVKPRRSLLRRRAPGKSTGVRPVAANVDQVIVVGAARQPDWDPHMIDRFIAVAEASELAAVVVMNKIDLETAAASELDVYRDAGYAVLATSVRARTGIDELRSLLADKTSLFTGSSGVGKSTLLNFLHPGLNLRTGAVSARGGMGRHTTVGAEMHPLDGGFVVDTPGLRDIGLWGLSPAEVAAAFPELERFRGECHFDNCRHLIEPGCAVVEAVTRKELSAQRLSSYRRLLEEAGTAARHWE